MLCPIALALALAAQQDLTPVAAPDGATRVEYFVLEQPTEFGPRPVAVIALRRVPGEAGLLLEQELVFREAGLRVLVDEHYDLPGGARSPRLVWRELRSSPATGRTWLAEWDAEQACVVTANHGTRAPVHGRLPGPCPTFPLALVEALRAGSAPAKIETLDPRARAGVTLVLREVHDGARRELQLEREDGSFAGRYVFEGDALVELQLQRGRVARPCDAAEFERLARRWEVHYQPLGDLRAWSQRPRARAR